MVRCWFAGVGLRFCFVQLTGQDMVDRATLNTSAWRVGPADGWSPHLYVFAGDFRDGQRLYSRFFAPAIGVAEDPATGSACVTLVASLADGSPQPDGSFHLRIDQGVAMDRPSLLHATARKEHGKVTEVSVCGRGTIIGHGIITIPARDRQTERAADWRSVKSPAWQAHFLGGRLALPASPEMIFSRPTGDARAVVCNETVFVVTKLLCYGLQRKTQQYGTAGSLVC